MGGDSNLKWLSMFRLYVTVPTDFANFPHMTFPWPFLNFLDISLLKFAFVTFCRKGQILQTFKIVDEFLNVCQKGKHLVKLRSKIVEIS